MISFLIRYQTMNHSILKEEKNNLIKQTKTEKNKIKILIFTFCLKKKIKLKSCSITVW